MKSPTMCFYQITSLVRGKWRPWRRNSQWKGGPGKGKGEVIRPKSLSDAKGCLRNRTLSGTFWGGISGVAGLPSK